MSTLSGSPDHNGSPTSKVAARLLEVARLAFASLTLVLLLGCSQPPDARTVQVVVAGAVKATLEPHLGPVNITVEKVEFGRSFTGADRHGTKRTYFHCKATYTMVDARGNSNKCAVWAGDFTMDEQNKWIVVSHTLP